MLVELNIRRSMPLNCKTNDHSIVFDFRINLSENIDDNILANYKAAQV